MANLTRLEALGDFRHITDIDRYFVDDETSGAKIFVGKRLEVRIPKRYEVHNLLKIGDTVETLAVVDLIFDNECRAGLMMLCSIEMDNSGIYEMSVDGIPYVCVTLVEGDRFMTNTMIVKNKNIVYSLFVEFVTRGKLIYWMDYETIFRLFDQAGPMCDGKLDVDHVIFEVLYSHLYRDPENLHIQYRHTDQTKFPKMIGLRSINYGTTSTTAKLLGANFPIGLNSALINQTEKPQLMEDLLRS